MFFEHCDLLLAAILEYPEIRSLQIMHRFSLVPHHHVHQHEVRVGAEERESPALSVDLSKAGEVAGAGAV
jgi:hypothetical protein